jgi:peptidoglycan-associated lipoprotein
MRTRPAAVVSLFRGCPFAGWLAGAVLSLFAAAFAIPALAQDRGAGPDESPLGTFTVRGAVKSGFPVVEPQQGLPATAGGNAVSPSGAEEGGTHGFFQTFDTPSSEDLAQSLYDDAMKALDAGHSAQAQRLLERLIADAPDSELAGEARQRLGRLYRAVETGVTDVVDTKAGVATPPPPEAIPEPDLRSAAAIAAPIKIDAPVPQEVLSEARVSIALDEQFLSGAGDRVFFSAGSADLGSRARGVLHAQARFLLLHPDLGAAVEGHADDGPMSKDETQRLSEERAAAVRDRLIAEGVESDRLTAFGRGRGDRVSECPAPECLAQNRRVITVLLEGRPSFGAVPSRRAQNGPQAPPSSAPTQ